MGPEVASEAVEASASAPIAIPIVAIGGITVDRLGPIVRAGCRTVAVCAAVIGANDPKRAARELKRKLTAKINVRPKPNAQRKQAPQPNAQRKQAPLRIRVPARQPPGEPPAPHRTRSASKRPNRTRSASKRPNRTRSASKRPKAAGITD
ncbi:MAG TPA: thiamine phosphate synthase [Phycisphaerae bacterium]|nr:thiamine phosphate synthase [Phycisphaerae bacterium]